MNITKKACNGVKKQPCEQHSFFLRTEGPGGLGIRQWLAFCTVNLCFLTSHIQRGFICMSSPPLTSDKSQNFMNVRYTRPYHSWNPTLDCRSPLLDIIFTFTSILLRGKMDITSPWILLHKCRFLPSLCPAGIGPWI